MHRNARKWRKRKTKEMENRATVDRFGEIWLQFNHIHSILSFDVETICNRNDLCCAQHIA